jgi:hypothetical protein
MNLNNKVLLAGPWIGEFGWELFCWQGYIRRLSKIYNKTIIISRVGHEFLYEDFANEFYSFDAPASKANMWLGEVNQLELKKIIFNTKHSEHLMPFNIGYGTDGLNVSKEFFKQDFIKYKSDTINKHYDIIIHPRNKIVGGARNWCVDNWQKLIDLLQKNYSIAEIGTNEAFKLNDVDDYRNISIRDTVSLMNRSKLVVGGASGPLHLASLCGTPHFLWSEEYSRIRFATHWNPHNTKMFFHLIKNWNPSVDEIYDGIVKSMNEL